MTTKVCTLVVRVKEGSRRFQGDALLALAKVVREEGLQLHVRYVPLPDSDREEMLYSNEWRVTSDYRLHLFRHSSRCCVSCLARRLLSTAPTRPPPWWLR